MGPLLIPLIGMGAQLLSKKMQEEEAKKAFAQGLPQDVQSSWARQMGVNPMVADTQGAINKFNRSQDSNPLQYGGMIASLVQAMGQQGPVDPNEQYRDPSKIQEADYVNGRLRPDDELQGSKWARGWRPYGT